jgi:hypothetical protein
VSISIIRRFVSAAAGFALLMAVSPARSQGFMSSSSGATSGSSFGSNQGSGSSFLGSSGSGSSSTGFLGSSGGGSGSSFLGSTGTGTGSRTGTGTRGGTTTTPGSTTFLGPSYYSPVAMGFSGLTTFPASSANPSVIRSSQFGSAMFNITQSTLGTGTSSTAYNSKSSYGTAVVQPAVAAAAMNISTVGVRKAPSYVTEARFRLPPVALAALEADVRGAVENSSPLQSNGNRVRVVMDGPVVVLRGTVGGRDDRNLAEDLVRLIPGVTAVSNELTVRSAE